MKFSNYTQTNKNVFQKFIEEKYKKTSENLKAAP